MYFACFDSRICYENMLKNIKEVKINLWNNNWFDIYDFTVNKYYDNISGKCNHYIVDKVREQDKIVSKIVSKIK